MIKEEFLSTPYGKPSAPQQIVAYHVYSYNSSGHLTEIKDYRQDGGGSLVLGYSTQLQYNSENKISQIVVSSGTVISCKWTENLIETTTTFADKRVEIAYIELNTIRLPVKKTKSYAVQEILYDSADNVIKTVDNSTSLVTQYIEYDPTRINPKSSNYELRILTSLSTNEGFVGVSKNWLLKYKDSYNTIRVNDYIVKEANNQGYPTLVETTGSTSTNSIKYTYMAE
ncbi:hypothetical protein [Fibrella aquatilis]|uniref:YD repeat-containing protein n=1 Tax=Fibrella aquatilis TaxID=2817059 RepID=A0A939G935_9BACT|nr:hypothetical protein [Fibrella aquatilis]MBO0932387.1 hypothetical protein [Fibrella aquatilis]